MAGTGVSFIVVTLLVSLGLTDAADRVLREFAGPGDVWGARQVRADQLVEALRPAVVLVAVLSLTGVLSLARRTVRPWLCVVPVVVMTAVATLATKQLLRRPDTHDLTMSYGGSYPSGHTACLVVGLGLAVLLVAGRSRWVWPVALAGGVLMGSALLVESAHWASDVLGGGLLGGAVLAVADVTGLSGFAEVRADPSAKETS